MTKIIFAAITALVLHPIGRCAQTTPKIAEQDFVTGYDAFIRKTMERFPEIPSVAIVVVKGDKAFFMKAYGMANREAGKQADVNTLYYIASSTKSFMALAAAQLDREGKIKLADPLTKYAPGVIFKS